MEWDIYGNIYIYIWRRQWHPTPVLLPGKSNGWRSLVGGSPWGHTESDTTERLHFHFSLSCIGEGNGNALQCSCLENPRDGEAWWAAVYGVAQSRTRLKWLSSSIYIYISITHLPSQSGNKVYKWLFPNIHFYCSDASYDFTHGPDPVVCESCSLTPEEIDVRRASVTTAQLSLAAAAGVGTGTGLGIKRFSTALLHLEHRQVLLKVHME